MFSKIASIFCILGIVAFVPLGFAYHVHNANSTTENRTLEAVGKCYERRIAMCKRNCTAVLPATVTAAEETACASVTQKNNTGFLQCLNNAGIQGTSACFSLNDTTQGIPEVTTLAPAPTGVHITTVAGGATLTTPKTGGDLQQYTDCIAKCLTEGTDCCTKGGPCKYPSSTERLFMYSNKTLIGNYAQTCTSATSTEATALLKCLGNSTGLPAAVASDYAQCLTNSTSASHTAV